MPTILRSEIRLGRRLLGLAIERRLLLTGRGAQQLLGWRTVGKLRTLARPRGAPWGSPGAHPSLVPVPLSHSGSTMIKRMLTSTQNISKVNYNLKDAGA